MSNIVWCDLSYHIRLGCQYICRNYFLTFFGFFSAAFTSSGQHHQGGQLGAAET
jgi:hypothetical protein